MTFGLYLFLIGINAEISQCVNIFRFEQREFDRMEAARSHVM